MSEQETVVFRAEEDGIADRPARRAGRPVPADDGETDGEGATYGPFDPDRLPDSPTNLFLAIADPALRQKCINTLLMMMSGYHAVVAVGPETQFPDYGAGMEDVVGTGHDPAAVGAALHQLHVNDPKRRVVVIWDNLESWKRVWELRCVSCPRQLNVTNIIAVPDTDVIEKKVLDRVISSSALIVQGYNVNHKKAWKMFNLCPWMDIKPSEFCAWYNTELFGGALRNEHTPGGEVLVAVNPRATASDRLEGRHVSCFSPAPDEDLAWTVPSDPIVTSVIQMAKA